MAATAVAALIISAGAALSTGPAFAADDAMDDATVSETPGSGPSGRPGKILKDDECQAVWEMTEREGDVLEKGKAEPFVINFEEVDTNNDDQLSSEEFTEGCKKGWIKSNEGTDAE
jgi:hypothetical protein